VGPGRVPPALAIVTTTASNRLSASIFRVGLDYKFGVPRPSIASLRVAAARVVVWPVPHPWPLTPSLVAHVTERRRTVQRSCGLTTAAASLPVIREASERTLEAAAGVSWLSATAADPAVALA
jgi:hypothetical protein